MATIKGILSFPALFQPKMAKGATEAKYGCSILIPPGDPQIAVLQAEVEQAKLNGCPSGYNGADVCFNAYDTKYAGKEYYDPRFTGWYVFSCSAKANDKPQVVDASLQPVIDPASVYPGAEVYVNAGISYYPKGKAGIGGWLNGVMVTGNEGSMGRLDNKPTIDQMFAGVAGGAPQTAPTPGAAPTPPAPPQPPAAPQAPAPAPTLQMTAAANGVTYEAYMKQNWTDELLIQHGLAIKPSFA